MTVTMIYPNGTGPATTPLCAKIRRPSTVNGRINFGHDATHWWDRATGSNTAGCHWGGPGPGSGGSILPDRRFPGYPAFGVANYIRVRSSWPNACGVSQLRCGCG